MTPDIFKMLGGSTSRSLLIVVAAVEFVDRPTEFMWDVRHMDA